jgi:hypothetical protein
MIRTLAVLLLLLGLATATPVVCLCAPSEAAGIAAGLPASTALDGAAPSEAASTADPRSLVATSAAAVVASLVAAAGGLPAVTRWQLPRPMVARRLPPTVTMPPGPARSPAVPPPR